MTVILRDRREPGAKTKELVDYTVVAWCHRPGASKATLEGKEDLLATSDGI